ncbi:hypothetical protein [Serratia rubidaea]|uniref:Uncharacterized protein n=1 Tax=Serratia rubidaea TaxID=61652 RepID=A0A448S1X5_SERRU|nr:hypothetical protein [Serratia rubidaea]VEI61594.1 Uncharacterised protein [Serratia rubidaea]
MASTISSVSICSNALLLLGDGPINSFDEGTDHARLCANLYPSVRDDLLRKHPWNCAVKRVVLSPSAIVPVFGFRFQFPLPGDMVRILSIGAPWEYEAYRVEGNKILANMQSLHLRYVFRNENEATWDPALVQLAEVTMAAKLAYAVTGSASLRDALTQEAAFLLRQAKAIDGQEEPPEELGGYPTLESRF